MLMVFFFFYKKLTNIELIKKISTNFTINDGCIIIQNYDDENNILEISNEPVNNNKILHGKLVHFNMKLEEVIEKINGIQERKFNAKETKYTLNTIWVNNMNGGVCKAYIIY
jgi:hypothetical protein